MAKAFEWLESQTEGMIDLQRELVAQPAVGPQNGGPGERAKAARLAAWCAERGLPVLRRWDAPDERAEGGVRPNFAVGLDGRSESPCIWVMSHLDVVPPGEQDETGRWKEWTGDPYALRVKDGRVYGRGVEDDHLGVVSSVFGLLALKHAGPAPAVPVRLLFVSDEETGSGYGLGHVLKTDPGSFSRDDIIVVPDYGNDEGTRIEVAEKSILWLRFRVKGRQCHGSMPQAGVNACRVAAHLIVQLEGLRTLYDESSPIFEPPVSTFEPTRREANVPNINTVPGLDIFHFDCRILPGIDVDEVLGSIREICDETAGRFGAEVEIEAVQRNDATQPTPEDAPVVTALRNAIRDVLGREAVPMGIGGGTVAALFRRAGYPAAVWLRCGHSAHQPDESCRVDFMLDNAKVFARLFAEPK